MALRARPKSNQRQGSRRTENKKPAPAGKPSGGGKRPSARSSRPSRGATKGKRSAGGSESDEVGPQRLQKVLAAAGLGSRRECESLITSGRVQVDGETITELGTKVDPLHQLIRVDGEALPRARKVYYLVNKPPGVLSTNRDPAGRVRVIDLVGPSRERVYAVGRLDQSSEGLILVTNDGELANQVTHPRYGVEKTYQVLVAGTPAPEALERLLGGIHLAEGVAKVDRLDIKTQHAKSTLLEMVLSEGRNREIRRLLARVGHKVLRLRRIGLGGLKMRGLKPGESRRLTSGEVEQLRSAVNEPAARPPRRAKRPSSRRRAAPTGGMGATGNQSSRSARKPSESRGKPRATGQRRPARPAGGARTKETIGRVIADDA